MRVILDTNVLVSGVFWRGPARRILELWMKGSLEVFVSLALLEEYEEVLNEIESKRASGLAEGWRMFVAEHATLVHASKVYKICRDPDDDEVLNCAAAARADFVVSGDKDLLVLKRLPDFKIVSPSDFLKRLR